MLSSPLRIPLPSVYLTRLPKQAAFLLHIATELPCPLLLLAWVDVVGTGGRHDALLDRDAHPDNQKGLRDIEEREEHLE